LVEATNDVAAVIPQITAPVCQLGRAINRKCGKMQTSDPYKIRADVPMCADACFIWTRRPAVRKKLAKT